MSGINIKTCSDGYWTRFNTRDRGCEEVAAITGKYLFFSTDRKALIEIALNEIERGPFVSAKVNAPENPPVGGDYVLCLYYRDDSLKYELARRYKPDGLVRYRYWKSDRDTYSGRYSSLHEQNLKKTSKEGEK